MQASKISLSPAEIDLFCNADLILTKNRILEQTIHLLDEVQNELVRCKKNSDLFSTTPKISRGENYLGLPYLILDYPRKSGDQGIFFIRSMFWWGNFFSSTLHISGQYREQYRKSLEHAYSVLASKEYYIGISPDPWMHHFEPDNFRLLSSMSENNYRNIIGQQAHIKIAAKWPLEHWDSAADLLIESWKLFIELITQAVK